jgi:hypothetical protein
MNLPFDDSHEFTPQDPLLVAGISTFPSSAPPGQTFGTSMAA